MVKSLLTKSTTWSYENEYRLLIQPEHGVGLQQDDGRVLESFTFSPACVRRVDFGARYPSEKIQSEIHALLTDYPHVEWRRAVYHETDFKLEYVTIDPTTGAEHHGPREEAAQ